MAPPQTTRDHGDSLNTDIRSLLPPRGRLLRGFWISLGLWVVFFVLTAYATAATLLDRIGKTDAMQAASAEMAQGRIASEIAAFVLMQVALHVFFAGLTWALACASAVVSEDLRQKLGRLVVGWFSVLAGAAIAFNALWYPRTLIGAYYHDFMELAVGPWFLGQVIYWGALAGGLAVLAAAAIKVLRRTGAPARRRALGAAAVVLVAVAAGFAMPATRPGHSADAGAPRPNVIILGIDSLRLDQLARFGGQGSTPNLDRFLATADLFPDTTTPAARTYPSWSSILTSRSPNITGARFNLANRAAVRISPTIGDVLRQAGYRTIYSTDEVRFANIDESYGFDQVVTPRIGASDFILGSYNEFPLASMVINTPIARWMFPFSYGNRGAATMYHPGTFVDRIRREVSFDEPTLFISHLTAAHWPYYTGETPLAVRFGSPDDPRSAYRDGLRTADTMFHEILAVLEQKGALRNALVIVLSDHGEAFGLRSDSFFDARFEVDGLRAPLKMLDMGHGQSVLSKSQYQILLTFRTFGTETRLGTEGRSIAYPATTEDIAPTILEFLGIGGDPLASTGSSLLPYLSGGKAVSAQDDARIRFTETDLSVLPAPGGRVDEEGTARKNALFFEVNPANGRLQMRRQLEPIAKGYKERAAYTRDMLLAAIPAGPYAHQYLLVDFANSHGRLLMARPTADDPTAQRLWDALEQHFPGELHTPVSITMADWPRIADEWKYYTEEGVEAAAHPGKAKAD